MAGRILKGCLVGAALPLAACGGSSGTATPPITLAGATVSAPGGNLRIAEVRSVAAGSGANFGGVIYIDDGAIQFLQEQTGSAADGTLFFTRDPQNFAIVSTPDGASPSQYSDLRLLRFLYTAGGQTFVTDGILGRFTSVDRMALASGTATYLGDGTAQVSGRPAPFVPTGSFDLNNGDTTVTVDFGAGTVQAVLRNFVAPSTVPIDTVTITGMTIAGNRFSGGTLSTTGNTVYTVTGADLDASGVFVGWNDGNGGVTGGNVPGEVGGVFVADAGSVTLVGRYAAD